MSADLLAEFGGASASNAAESTRETQRSSRGPPTSLFDDFEPPGRPDHGRSSAQVEPPDAEIWTEFHSAEIPGPTTKFEAKDEELWYQDDFGKDVLFDATTEEVPDDDDWGEFESAEPDFESKQREAPLLDQGTDSTQRSTKRSTNAPKNEGTTVGNPMPVDLLSDIDSLPAHNPPNASNVQYKLDQKSLNKSPQHVKQASGDNNISKLPDLDDEWGDFADAAPDEPSTHLEDEFNEMNITEPIAKPSDALEVKTPSLQITPSPEQFGSRPGPTKPSPSTSVDIRPMNIPPPFVILQIFTPLLEEYQKRASVPKSDQGGSKQKSMASDPNLAGDLVSTLKVAARVIAGRTLRWKRDTALSQSTKIGPARSGKTGGMKLTSVNKSESIKEEKEAMDVLDAWRNRAAHLNSFILATGHQIPLLSNNMHARTAGSDEVATKAAHACALCGLKREERILKIDESVEDSFGEWWTDHWGHTECKNFWDKNSRSLNQRY